MCITREGSDPRKFIYESDVLSKYQVTTYMLADIFLYISEMYLSMKYKTQNFLYQIFYILPKVILFDKLVKNYRKISSL